MHTLTHAHTQQITHKHKCIYIHALKQTTHNTHVNTLHMCTIALLLSYSLLRFRNSPARLHTSHMHMCICARIHAHTHVHTFTCKHSHMDTCMYIYTHMHSCVHAHIDPHLDLHPHHQFISSAPSRDILSQGPSARHCCSLEQANPMQELPAMCLLRRRHS